MPNHLHLLIFVNENESINKLLANGKRFLAYEIVKRLELQKQHEILAQLQLAVTAKEKERQKKHRLFEVSPGIKPCYTEKFLLQKLNHPPRRTSIHNNPIMPKWKLASHPEEYFHSGACFYILNNYHQFIRVTHWKDVGKHITHRLPLRRKTMLDNKEPSFHLNNFERYNTCILRNFFNNTSIYGEL